jgi:GNAT superfamily N-acetyltransferase
MSDTGIELYVTNNIARWDALGFPADSLPNGDEVFARHTNSGAQFVARRPLSPDQITDLLAEPVLEHRNVIEDAFGVGGVQVPEDVVAVHYPTMMRRAGPVEVVHRKGVEVVPVVDQAGLDQAERVIVEGFPRPELRPWSSGGLIPPAVLDVPGWHTWIAVADGEPGAAVVTYDDGRAAGVYWLATLPEHRGAGLASVLMTSVLTAHAHLPSVLVATKMARPLYERLGYRAVSEGCWYTRRR